MTLLMGMSREMERTAAATNMTAMRISPALLPSLSRIPAFVPPVLRPKAALLLTVIVLVMTHSSIF